MKHSVKNYLPGLALLLLLSGCAASEMGSAVKSVKLSMKIHEERNIINQENLQMQQALTLNERALAERGQSRGAFGPLAGSLVSMATDGVKKVIANDQKKYLATYQFALTDLYFYDQLSNEGAFDPVGLQFSGFRLIRTFTTKAGNVDTAMTANFMLDTANSSAMINNSVFRLRVKNFTLNYAKAKVAKADKKMLNLDFEITFLTSYVSSEGRLFDSVVLGKFYLFLRKAPLEKTAEGYNAYYCSLKDSLLNGKSFIVPRSFGYHREPDGRIMPGYSQGGYSIQVKVKESSKSNFVTKLVMENANLMIDATRDKLKSELKSRL